MTKSEAMWIGYWAMRQDIETCLKALARGTPDPYWEGHIEKRVDAAMIFYSEYRRLNHLPSKRRKRAA